MGKYLNIKVPKKQLYQWYVIENKTYKDLMQILGTKSARKIKKLLVNAGINPRDKSEGVKIQWINADERKKKQGEWAKKVFAPHWKQAPSDETREKIRQSKLGKKNWMYGKIKEKHHLYLGGKKNWEKGRKIEPEIKAKIREQLGNKCEKCGTNEGITIHHDPPYRIVRSHDLKYLHLLCKKCHFHGPVRLR